MKISIPLLLTSAVDVSAPFTKIIDPSERIDQTLDSLRQWLRIDPLLKIVICDGSNFDLQPLIDRHVPKANIEVLHFRNDAAKVASFGKGYGEGEIVAHALKHSKTLAFADAFAKCTARLWVDNYAACLSAWNNRFLCDFAWDNWADLSRPVLIQHFDTRFYMVSKELYLEVFLRAHDHVDDRNGYQLEHSFRDAALAAKLRNFAFPRRPLVRGVSGSTGTIYTPSLKGTLRDYLHRTVVRFRTDFISNGLP